MTITIGIRKTVSRKNVAGPPQEPVNLPTVQVMSPRVEPVVLTEPTNTDADKLPTSQSSCCCCPLGCCTFIAFIASVCESAGVIIGGAHFLHCVKSSSTCNYNQNQLRITAVVLIICGALLLIASIVLLWAVLLNRRSLLTPWLFIRVITIPFYIINCIVILISLEEKIRPLCYSLVVIATGVYTYVVVFAYYKSDVWNKVDILQPEPSREGTPLSTLRPPPYTVLPVPTCPPMSPNFYNYPPPVYSVEQAASAFGISYSQDPINPYFQPQNPYNAWAEPPPYSPEGWDQTSLYETAQESQHQNERNPPRY